MVPFLPCSVPDVHAHGVSLHLNLFLEKTSVQSRLLAAVENTPTVSQEERGFAHTSYKQGIKCEKAEFVVF